jgi:pilus assembly protein Flp/PilA
LIAELRFTQRNSLQYLFICRSELMYRFLSRLKRKDREGQGLVEYALILVLVAIVVIAILTLFGQAVANTYCGVVYTLHSGSKPVKICKAPIVTCVATNTSSTFAVEAKVMDPDAPAPATPGNYNSQGMIVQFYVNDQTQLRDGDFLDYEDDYNYCFKAGAGACTGASKPSEVRSGDTVKAIATDRDGNKGTCSVTVP